MLHMTFFYKHAKTKKKYEYCENCCQVFVNLDKHLVEDTECSFAYIVMKQSVKIDDKCIIL
jgi:hypothetical protein